MLHHLPDSAQAFLARLLFRIPDRVWATVLRHRDTHAGATLDLRAQVIVSLANTGGRPEFHQLPVEAARREFGLQVPLFAPAPQPMDEVADRQIPGPAGPIPVRLYRPKGGVLPVLVYYHGGGWVLGDLDSYDALCRELAAKTGCLVLSVDYRLAPEHRYPAAPDDALAAFLWAAEHAASLGGDPTRIAIGGDSAGGNLTAVTAQRATDLGGPVPCLQLLIYPAVDLRCETESHRAFGPRRIILNRQFIDWYRGHYWRDERDILEAGMSPALRHDLRGLPPAFVLTAGFDPLHDEGRDYARCLDAAGVPTTYRCYQTMFHGFIGLGAVLPQASAAVQECADALQAAFA